MVFKFKQPARPHPVQEMVAKLRQTFLKFGLSEVINPMIIDESEVYKQYGPEAAVILDRCFYLAELPRPEIGLSNEKLEKIDGIALGWRGEICSDCSSCGCCCGREGNSNSEATLRNLLREYKKGNIEGDNMLEEMVKQLNITTEQAARILDEIFAELKDLKPQPTTKTLRSHMTSAWFPVLAKAQKKSELPVGFFSIGPRFRREQKLDATHLYESTTASAVVMDKEFSEAEICGFVSELCKTLGFEEINIVRKKATAQYYENNKEWEVYASINGKDVEIADFGLYSKRALKKYKITFPVFNIGFGVERLAMISTKSEDIRNMVYWNMQEEVSFSDEEIIKQIEINEKPNTKEGFILKEAIAKTAKKYASEKSPCNFTAFEGEFLGKKIKVSVVEKEENTKLLGPACLNDIYAFEGSVYGIPEENAFKGTEEVLRGKSLSFCGSSANWTEDIKNKGFKANFSFLDAISSYFAAKIETLILQEQKTNSLPKANNNNITIEKTNFWQLKMAKTPAEANIKVSEPYN
ncbi:MAG: O-phosphoserine--tRNA ligase [Euryarchaeota archaeon HGW-Euryarchaeota-1]|nr:MAG: O-phosphoserine--tRNA ligase [Euryarchaeota archaeon HGW-Euryarchaeota-1]